LFSDVAADDLDVTVAQARTLTQALGLDLSLTVGPTEKSPRRYA
jgi:hypothetical protein